MYSIEGILNLNFSREILATKNFIDSAQVKTTFWGSRVVEVKGYTGSVYLDDLARKILEAGGRRCEADDLLPAERIAGIGIVRKLKDFYRTSDIRIKNSNFFTRLLNWIREFSFFPYTTRFYIEETAEIPFRAYSEGKFLQQFGGTFDAMHNHPASNGSFGPPFRILAKEDRIRALVV